MVFSRCFRSKCPVCGRGSLFARLTEIKNARELVLPVDHCEVCQFQFARQPGYYMGVLTPVLPILALMTGLVFAAISYFGFHEEISVVLGWGGFGVALGFVAFFRKAIAIYVAIDHLIDPPHSSSEPH